MKAILHFMLLLLYGIEYVICNKTNYSNNLLI